MTPATRSSWCRASVPAPLARGRALVAALEGLGVEVRSLYDRYPDFDIDAAAEQAALDARRLVVWLHPLYWYGVPALLKHWFDTVLVKGWAYGEGGARSPARIASGR